MIKSRPSPYASIFLAITMFIILPAPSPAQVRVLMSGGFSAAYQELLPEFQKTTGITVTTARGPSQGDGPNTIGAQLRRGVPADMVIMSRNGLAELFGEGKIVMGSDVDLAEVPLGIGVRVGAPRPDISTVDAFKQALLRAKSVGTQSSSTIYMTTKLFPQLGIASAMAGYIVERWAGTFVHQSFPSLRCPYGGLVFVQLKPVDMFRNRNGLIDDGPLL